MLGFLIYNWVLGQTLITNKATQIDRGKEEVRCRKTIILQSQIFKTPFYFQVMFFHYFEIST